MSLVKTILHRNIHNKLHRPLLGAWLLNMDQACHFGQPAAQTHPYLMQQGEVTPGIMKAEFALRRTRLMEEIAKTPFGSAYDNHLILIPSGQKMFMAHDVPYPYRQCSDFLYLCGFQEPNSLLVVEKQCDSDFPRHKSTLFVPKRDKHKELWEGPRSGSEGALELTGVDAAHDYDELKMYLTSFLKDNKQFVLWYDHRKPSNAEMHFRDIAPFLKDCMISHCITVEVPKKIIQHVRLVKSAAEVKLMQESCDIASEAFKKVMNFSHPGINEAHLYAKMDFECRMNGADKLAYPPVVAGGNRANIIHYIINNQVIEDGDMVLMDAGCERHSYCSDITRTWPISGQFSSAQLELYEAVLEIQDECLHMCSANTTLEEIYQHMLKIVGKQLKRLKIASDTVGGHDLRMLSREYCPHHVGHYLGMDVHDSDEVSRHIKLKPGMCITIEPGLYIPQSDTKAPKEFLGTGIRIEDDVLITSKGSINLTKACPKYPQDLHFVMNN